MEWRRLFLLFDTIGSLILEIKGELEKWKLRGRKNLEGECFWDGRVLQGPWRREGRMLGECGV